MSSTHEDGSEFRDWLAATQGQEAFKACDAIQGLLEDVEIEVSTRSFRWPDGQGRSFEESISELHARLPDTSPTEIRHLLIDWMEDPARLQETSGESTEEQQEEDARGLSAWIEELDQAAP